MSTLLDVLMRLGWGVVALLAVIGVVTVCGMFTAQGPDAEAKRRVRETEERVDEISTQVRERIIREALKRAEQGRPEQPSTNSPD
jgi:hypothetical protein